MSVKSSSNRPTVNLTANFKDLVAYLTWSNRLNTYVDLVPFESSEQIADESFFC